MKTQGLRSSEICSRQAGDAGEPMYRSSLNNGLRTRTANGVNSSLSTGRRKTQAKLTLQFESYS